MWTKFEDYRSFTIYRLKLDDSVCRYRGEDGKVGTMVCNEIEKVRKEIDDHLEETSDVESS